VQLEEDGGGRKTEMYGDKWFEAYAALGATSDKSSAVSVE